MSIDLQERLNNYTANKTGGEIVKVKGRTFVLEPLGADQAFGLFATVLDTFGPAFGRLTENWNSLDIQTSSEVNLFSEPLGILASKLNSPEYRTDMLEIFSKYVTEDGVAVDPNRDLKGKLGIYLILQWHIIKENVLEAFIDCMEAAGMNPDSFMQDIKSLVSEYGYKESSKQESES